MNERSRILWRCRRGIREMDILLQRFMELHYPGLSKHEIKLFEELLEESDLDILAWITGKSEPEKTDYQILIQRLQELSSTH